MGKATLLHFNVFGGEGLDEQLNNWTETKVSLRKLCTESKVKGIVGIYRPEHNSASTCMRRHVNDCISVQIQWCSWQAVVSKLAIAL